MPRKLTGRWKIVTDYDIVTPENVREALADAMGIHSRNASDINYLFRYFRGEQPIRDRVKTVRPDITYNTVINHASEIVSFKVSYMLSEPIVYVSRKDADPILLQQLNDYMYLAGKQTSDKELADDFSICGCAYRYVERNPRFDGMNCPFIISTLNPARTFVAYRNSTAKNSEPVFAVTYVTKKNIGRVYDVFTPQYHMVLTDRELTHVEVNPLGMIPIIEYDNNEFKVGSFEVVLDLLNDMNTLESNRIEATEQNVQALMWFNDIELTEEEEQKLKESPSAFVFTRTIKDSTTPNIKTIAVDLQQSDQQVLTNDLYKKILTIVGMPSTGDGNTSDSSNNGSTIVRNGWQHAEARAKDTAILWERSDKRFLQCVLAICDGLLQGFPLQESDVIGKFTRRTYEAAQTKATVLTTLLGCDKVHPRQAYQACGLMPDPEEAYRQGMEWYEEQKKEAREEQELQQAAAEEKEETKEDGNE